MHIGIQYKYNNYIIIILRQDYSSVIVSCNCTTFTTVYCSILLLFLLTVYNFLFVYFYSFEIISYIDIQGADKKSGTLYKNANSYTFFHRFSQNWSTYRASNSTSTCQILSISDAKWQSYYTFLILPPVFLLIHDVVNITK